MNNKNWQIGTLEKTEQLSEHMRKLVFSFKDEQIFQAGQHYDIRLTAPDGYSAERSYSIASSPREKNMIEFGIELLPDGEVSPYLCSIKQGTQVELRGPIGGHFTWDINIPGPLILIGGGSGLVPLMSMLRHHIDKLDKDSGRSIICIVSSRNFARIPYWEELQDIAKKDSHTKVIITLTDSHPLEWKGHTKRVDAELLQTELHGIDMAQAHVYICGSNPFVEAVSKNIVGFGIPPVQIKTERYGG